jgi:acyl carrier protein
MSEIKLFEIIARVLNTPIEEIDEQSNPKIIPSWDSFSGYILLDEIELAFNVNITLEEALKIENVGDFKKILKEKGINFE